MSLAAVLTLHHDELESDLACDGVDLLDYYRGDLSARRLNVLIKGLPGTSALVRTLDPEGTAWTVTDHLLAAVVDVLQAANWQRSGNAQLQRPSPLPRPTDSRKKKPAQAQLAYLEAIRARHRRENQETA